MLNYRQLLSKTLRINRIFCNVNDEADALALCNYDCINRIFCNVNFERLVHEIGHHIVLIEYFVM